VRSITKKLVDFGFNAEQARQAAVAAGTFNGALEILTSRNNLECNSGLVNGGRYEDDLAKAIEASLSSATADEKDRVGQVPASESRRGAAISKAAAAAEARAAAFADRNNRSKSGTKKGRDPKIISTKKTASAHAKYESSSRSPVRSHPNVTVPPPLASAPLHDQLVRCASRLAPHPRALDTLRRSLIKLAKDPYSSAYKTIETGTGTLFETVLVEAPGASELLRAVGFVALSSPTPRLHITDPDEVVLAMALSALEEAKKTDEYLSAKSLIIFAEEVSKEVENKGDATERALYGAKIPPEPKAGNGEGAQSATIRVILHPKLTVSRRFDCDDTVGDVINWVGTHSSVVADRLWQGVWGLENVTIYPPQLINCSSNSENTLQGSGLWPSGTLRISPAKGTGLH